MEKKERDEQSNGYEKDAKKTIEAVSECLMDVLTSGIEEQRRETGKDQKKNKSVADFPIPPSNKLIMDALRQNEDGDAYLYRHLLANKHTYDHSSRNWYYWAGHHWERDRVDEYLNATKVVIKAYEEELVHHQVMYELESAKDNKAQIAKYEKNVKALCARVSALQTLKRKLNVTRIAASGFKTLGYAGDKWDQHRMLFPCINGTIDLKNGTFRDGDPLDYFSKVSRVEWKGISEPCPTWEKFVETSLGGDLELVGFIQRLFGYALTGLGTEKIYPIFWGSRGRNGKSTMLEIVKHIMCDMAYKLPNTYFVVQPGPKSSGSADAETMALRGRRMGWGSETNKKDRLDLAKLKERTGGDTVSAREPYGKHQVEFKPTFLLILLTNARPKIQADDDATWRRIKLVPFNFSFVEDPDPSIPWQKQEIPDLTEKLEAEASGILAWMVQGCIWWQREGLNPPTSIDVSTKEYRKSEDIIANFIDDECITGPENDPAYWTSAKKLYDAYRKWCIDEAGHHPQAKKHFMEEMKLKFQYKKYGSWSFRGIFHVGPEKE